VKEAAKEIKDGIRYACILRQPEILPYDHILTSTSIGLDWPLDAQSEIPFFNRAAFHKEIIHKAPRIVNDDIWTFNSQSSSQWDGLRHFAYQKAERFYNNVSLADIHGPNATNVNGIGAWAARGIVGRGVLLDYHSWRSAQGKGVDKHHSFRTGSIPVADLKATAEWQGTEIKFGDILFIRSGYMASYEEMSRDELEELTKVMPPKFFGVEQSEELLEWVWSHFSAVAGDQPSFECWREFHLFSPVRTCRIVLIDGIAASQKEWACHEVFLAGWGLPIGELFDLEALAAHCKEHKRYSFFLSSEPCNVS